MSRGDTTGQGGPIDAPPAPDLTRTRQDDPGSPVVGRARDEMVARWRRGDRVSVESLRREWPGLGRDADDLFELIYAEYLLREEAGEPALRPLLDRFPGLSDRLRRRVAMGRPIGDPCEAAGLAAEDTVFDGQGRAPSDAMAWPMPAGYEFRRLLGRGGMGVVYEALQVRLNRVVALKMIRAGAHASAEDRGRFEAEAEAIARLRHPNIVQVHAVGDAGGQPFFEMEYVDGGSLADRLGGTPRPTRDASTLVEAVARAIHEAHLRGVVHRDLKPSNILLMADGSPKIVDFGLAKLIGSDSGLTRTDSVLGSPAYMAPEQAGGQAGAVGPAADVYALGAILYEMLTGRQVFVAGTALETLDLVRNAEPVSPSRFRPSLPRDLETICLRCLAKDPARRYATAEALADDLGRWGRGESILARPAGLMEKGYRWSRRNRAVAGLLASVALLLVGGTTGMAILWGRARAEAALSRSLAAKEALANVELARMSAGLVLDRGLALAAGGDVGRGLPYMARAVRIDGDGRTGLGEAARANLAAWSPLVPRTVAAARLGATANTIEASRDGRVVAIGGKDGSLTLWDPAASRATFATGPRPGGPIGALAIRPDGQVVAANASDRGRIEVWDASTGRAVGEPIAIRKGFSRMAFHPDGSILAATSEATLWLLDLATGRPIGHPITAADQIQGLAFSPDGATLVVVDKGGAVDRRDGRTGRPLGPPFPLGQPAWCVAFRPDGARFAVGFGPLNLARRARHDNSGVRAFEAATGRPVGPRMPHGSGVGQVAYRPDGRALLSGDTEGIARLWDGEGSPIGEPLRGEGVIDQVGFGPDGSIAFAKSNLGMARLWSPKTGRQVGATLEQPGLARVAWDPDGRGLALFHDDQVRTVDLGPVLTPARAIQKETRVVGFLDEGRAVASSGQDGVARIVSAGDGRPIGWPMPHQEIITALDVSPDGRLIATGARDATIRIWDAQGRPTAPPIPVHHWVAALRFGPDGRRLLASDEHRGVWLIDATTGKPLASPIRHPMDKTWGRVRTLFFSGDGAVGYSVATSGTIGRIDGETGRPIGTFWDVPAPISCEALAPDGRALALAVPGEVRMIDLATGRGRSLAMIGGVRALAFTPDGRTLVGGCVDKMVRSWSATTGAPDGPPIPLPGTPSALSISPDGRTLVTTTDDQALAWDLAGRKQVGPARFQDPNLALPGFSPDGRALAVTDEMTRLHPLPGPDATPAPLLPGRVAALTGIILDAQGGIALAAGPTPDPAGPTGADDWHARVATELGLGGDHAAALWHLDRAVAGSPDDWHARALRSEALARLGRGDEARAEAGRARALAGPDRAARWDAHRGFAAASEGLWDDAIAAFDRVLAYGPPGPSLYRDARGWAKTHRRDWAGASEDLSAGSWRHYSMLDDLFRAGIVALVAEDRRFHRAIVAKLVLPWDDRRLKDPEVASLLAWFGALGPDAIDDPGLLVRLAEPAPRVDGKGDGIAPRVRLGMALHRAGRFEEAIVRLTEVHRGRRVDETGDARAFLAMAHRRLGHAAEARHWLGLARGEALPPDELDAMLWKGMLREAEAVVLDPDFPADPFRPGSGE